MNSSPIPTVFKDRPAAAADIDGNCQVVPFPVATAALSTCATLLSYDAESRTWLTSEGLRVRPSLSLLLKPQKEDLVLLAQAGQQYFIVQVLERCWQDEASATLELECQQSLEVKAPKLRFCAWQELELISLNRLSLLCTQGLLHVAGNLVQRVENWIQQIGQLNQNVRGLLRSSARQQVVTAEEDVRIDGKRINMG